MSAKNHRRCPRCARRATAKQRKRQDRADAAYGQVPAHEYRRLLLLAEGNPEPPTAPYPFREDYEIGTDDRGVFVVRYRGECSVCNLTFEFKHEAKVLGEGE